MARSRRLRCVHIGLLWLVYSAIQMQMASVRTALADATSSDVASGITMPDLDDLEPAGEPNTSPNPRYSEDESTFAAPEAGGGSESPGSESSTEAGGSTTAATPHRRHHTHPTYRPRRENCTPPAIEQFPPTLMGPWLRRHGGLILHVLVAIFTFFGLAIVCEDYFVSSLDRICEELKMSPDVAGATFMAIGSSAPELGTVMIGVFVANDDIGVSGVIGSAVFNIMFVISVCALTSNTVCHLNWWPLVRDCFFYLISILVMLVVIFNDYISWYEALIMMLIYVVYCVALHFNSALEKWAYSLQLPIKLPTKEEQSALVTFKNLPDSTTTYNQQPAAVTAVTNIDETAAGGAAEANYQDYTDPNASWDPNAAWDDSAPAAPAAPAAKAAPAASGNSWDPNASWNADGTTTGQQNYGYASGAGDQSGADSPPAAPKAIVTTTTTNNSAVAGEPEYYKSKEVNPQDQKNPLERPPPEAGLFALVSWRVVYPIHYMCRLTVPDCRTEKYRNWHAFTFLVSMVWISFYSYIMVWMITVIGSTLNIPDTVMGLTFVAAGVSVPDALSSIAVIKEGYGDMAVSNAVGSNVFDILVCLGLPWFIQTTIINPGGHVNVISKGLLYSTMSLLSTVIFLLASVHLNGWKLDKRLGIILMVWYLLFITLASMYELNLFGELNPPECASTY